MNFIKNFNYLFHLIKKYMTTVKRKIIFMSSVFGETSLKITSRLNPVFKVASFEANYFELLDKLVNKKINNYINRL